MTYNRNKIKHGIRFNLNRNDISPIIKKYKISRAVIMSAYSDLDFCKKNKKISHRLNVVETKKLISKLIRNEMYFIFFSTEQVYNGNKGFYTETSETKPKNLYGRQKLLIEKFITKKTKNFCIFRVAKTYTNNLNDKTLISDFLRKSKNKSVVYAAADQRFSPLYVLDLIKITNFFLSKKITGIFNVGGNEKVNRYNLYKFFNKNLKKNKKYKQVVILKKKIKHFNFFEKRPLNLTLNIRKLLKVIDFDLVSIKKIFLDITK